MTRLHLKTQRSQTLHDAAIQKRQSTLSNIHNEKAQQRYVTKSLILQKETFKQRKQIKDLEFV